MTTRTGRILGWVAAAWAAVFFIGAGFRVLADCSSFGLPFTDLGSETTFCAAIAEAYYTGLTNGTSATTFSPKDSVSRAAMAAFATRTLDASLSRGRRRAALGQWWNSTPRYDQSLGLTTLEPGARGSHPALLQSDGADIWVADAGGDTVARVRASDGKLLGTWTNAAFPRGILIAMGRVFVTGSTSPGRLYMIDPSQPAGDVATVANNLGPGPNGVTFDGTNIWTANGASVSTISPGTWSVTTTTTGFSTPNGILFDGTSIWVTDGTLKRLNPDGSTAQTVPAGYVPQYPVFDGHNIWLPNFGDDSLTVVRASDGTVVKTFSDGNGDRNGLSEPNAAAFDGQRVLVTNNKGGLSLFRATDLSPIGVFATPGRIGPWGACSDGVNFWVSFNGSGGIGRF